MRQALLAATLALGIPVAAQAQDRGEVILHVEVVGEVPPDVAYLDYTLEKSGKTQAEAERALAGQRAEATRRLAGAGVAPADIAWTPMPTSPSIVADSMVADSMETDPKGTALSQPTYQASGSLRATVRDITKVPVLTVGADEASLPSLSDRNIHFAMSNPDASHARAVQQGLAKAQREAETYAAAMHLRVGRIERISNTKPPLNMLDIRDLVGRLDGPGKMSKQDFVGGSTASIAVDYVLTR